MCGPLCVTDTFKSAQVELSETPDCPLCGNRGTLQHVLSGCNIALTQGRYTWRHNQVLRELAEVIEKQRKDAKHIRNKPIKIQFVKEGEVGQKSKKDHIRNAKSGEGLASAEIEDGRHGTFLLRLTAEASLHSQCGECSESLQLEDWPDRGGSNQKLAKQQRKHLPGYDEENSRAGTHPNAQ
ncbi:Hypothetical predicted protein [Mytilus galloprovincialis]|uniref:Reverse transcriptase zinc-binding domain-containing protein n=1 Tax=Mytilus galloprovincialis TaxID=29158 RepID=A0A8B6F5U1_MYTGA|nr:Hypothetical predicted protein [Mytilus galloprovincialis]